LDIHAARPEPLIQHTQQRLIALGYDPGSTDGVWGPKTEAALRKFQEDNSLPVTGRLDPTTLAKLGLQGAERENPTRDIVDLVREGKIDVKTEGSGIQTVKIALRSRVSYPITIRIPVGAYFTSRSGSAQDMVITSEITRELVSDAWVTVDVPAACANRLRDIPGYTDSFDVQRAPNQQELARLMSVLEQERASYPVRQAAVWIVTDDADYADLGVLVRRSHFQPVGGTRVIQEPDAAQAMKICDAAGIDITRKAIWRDRQRILEVLPEGAVKKWLREKK
jgi:hypothetical protein